MILKKKAIFVSGTHFYTNTQCSENRNNIVGNNSFFGNFFSTHASDSFVAFVYVLLEFDLRKKNNFQILDHCVHEIDVER